MSKPVFSDLFTLSGRRNRKSFFLYHIGLMVVLFVLWMIFASVGAASAANHSAAGFGVFGVILAVATIFAALSTWIVGGQRCRDFGWTGWAILITLVPVVGWIFAIALWFIPGDVGPNRYGPDPSQAGSDASTAGQPAV